MMKKTALTLLATVALTAGASAQLLTAFDVSGFGTTATGPTPVVDPSVTATALNRGTGLTFSSAANSFSSNNWNVTAALDTSTATGKYIFFDVTAGTAPVIFSNLMFAINGSNTAPANSQWAYTLDGGNTFTLGTTANGGAFTNTNVAKTTLATWDYTDFTLATGATVEFRFYEYGTTSINGGTAAATGTTRIQNIAGAGNSLYDLVVEGPNGATLPVNPVAAPEPTTWAIMAGGAALMGLLIYRRNRTA